MITFIDIAALICLTVIWNPVVAAPWKFVVTGDGRGSSSLDPINTNIMSEIVSAIVAESPDLLLFPGDLVYSGSEAAFRQWTNVLALVYNAGIGVYPIRGNHDLPDDAGWLNVFGADIPTNGPVGEVGFTYSFIHQNALFVGIDEYITPHRINQSWLLQQFATNRLPHVFIFGHEPAFKALHADCMDDYPADRDTFWTSLTDAGAVLYFAGHDHFYDHLRLDDGDDNPSNDLHQLIIGTAGGPLYDFTGSYDGDNGRWMPSCVFHDKQYGYVVVEVDGDNVTLTWKSRSTTNVFTAAEIFTYSTAQLSPVHYVTPSGSNIWPYLRWQTAATEIQNAVDAASDGDMVVVSNSTYVLSRQIAITNKAILVRTINGPKSVTIDGNNGTRCLYLAFSNAVVDGFTITRGNGTGGGVFIDGLGVIRNCVLTDNSALNCGGGICCDRGGIVQNCLVVSNSAGDCGGGIMLLTNGIVENCTVSANDADNCGGGVHCIGSGESGICVYNSILYANLAATGSNYYNSGSGIDCSFCCSMPLMAGVSNIDINPMFVDPAAGNYCLQEGSPCVDNGTNIVAIGKDLNGVSRPLDGNADGEARCDMGAYEFTHTMADTDLDGMSDVNEVTAGTDPINSASRFQAAGISVASTNITIRWESVLNRRYSVMTTSNLVSAGWTNVTDPAFTNIAGTGQSLHYTNADSVFDRNRFFRLKVWGE